MDTDQHTNENHFATEQQPAANEAPTDHRLITDQLQISHH